MHSIITTVTFSFKIYFGEKQRENANFSYIVIIEGIQITTIQH